MFTRKKSESDSTPAQHKRPTSLTKTINNNNNTTTATTINGITHNNNNNMTMENNKSNARMTGIEEEQDEEKNPTSIIENIEAANNTTTGNSVPLPTTVLQTLYHEYSIKQRQSGLKWFVFATILFNDWSLVVPQGQSIGSLVVTFLALLLNLGICICMHLSPLFDSSTAWSVRKKYIWFTSHAPHMLWAVSIIHFVLYSYLQQSISIRDILGWAILLNFLIYVTLPVTLWFSGLVFGVGTFIAYIVTIYFISRPDPLFHEQIYANIVLIMTAQIIGLLLYFMGEAKQKRTFLETKQSLEVKMIIEEQSAEQERLLLSVLPKHVAVRMRQDLGSTSSEPFKKIYMSRHENVSILYADIVGFTAISSTYSAQDLVKMLNELFARFDRLAEKYSQLRIKILGDCYYCISGAPNERPDHAVLCVHMGLSMVKAIKYVQQKTNSPVDMRVGIHTGAVLAGILGQRQWQFDVYSKDVELANKMESSGKAGRVHISDRTLSFLNGEFEVEPAYGERREEALRIAGLKTYFIARVLRPFPSPAGIRINEMQNNDNEQPDEDDELLANMNTTNSTTTTTTIEITVQSEIQNNSTVTKDSNDEETRNKMHDFKERLRDELIARDNHKNLSKGTTTWLKFTNDELETAYAAHREPYSSVPLIAALLVQISDVIYSYFIMPTSPLHFINISAPLIPILMLVFVSVAESFPRMLPQCFVTISKKFNDIHFVRELAAVIIVLTLAFSNLIDMYYFVIFLKTEHIVSEAEFNTTQHVGENISVIAIDMDNIMYPSYLSNYCVLILIAVAVIAQLTHLSKIVLMVIVTVLHCFFNIFILNDLFTFEDNLALKPEISASIATSSILVIVTFALSMFARHMDREDRIIFKWKTEVAEQKERATDMRERNEALVYNILPVHVARYFMKNTIRSHDDLYSQSYAEVGVLFASMPNFSDFYSEETVNNQGLECLRFLNEVISDFDALLELPKFRDIIKIKTIGSTYMAASGINTREIANSDEAVTKRYTHLAELVEFALELKKALQGINEQSFNHFVLKMGINHGPITAGVIGARKPHYDIWGNTVNVASRMESTGKAGAIQVTEETCNILKEFGYTFQQRGLVSVKGKGQLMTYYLLGKSDNQTSEITSHAPATTCLQTNGIAEVNLQRHEEPVGDPKTPLLRNGTDEQRVPNENDILLE